MTIVPREWRNKSNIFICKLKKTMELIRSAQTKREHVEQPHSRRKERRDLFMTQRAIWTPMFSLAAIQPLAPPSLKLSVQTYRKSLQSIINVLHNQTAWQIAEIWQRLFDLSCRRTSNCGGKVVSVRATNRLNWIMFVPDVGGLNLKSMSVSENWRSRW